MSVAGPITSGFVDIHPDWIDFNGHLNMGYYTVLLDLTCEDAWEAMGFGEAYRARTGCTTYSAEFHMRYLRELKVGDRVQSRFYLLDYDPKSFHGFFEMVHAEGWLAATGEGVTLHVDQSGPRVAPMPDDIQARLKAIHDDHATLPRPAGIGSTIGIRRKG